MVQCQFLLTTEPLFFQAVGQSTGLPQAMTVQPLTLSWVLSFELGTEQKECCTGRIYSLGGRGRKYQMCDPGAGGRKARQGRQARWSGRGASLSPGCPEALEKGELLCTRGAGGLGVPKESR